MTTLTDGSYFIRQILLPQAKDTYQISNVDNYIVQYEKEVLIRLLGYELYSLLQSAWDDYKQESSTPLPERFDRLINGYDYALTYQSKQVNTRWNGLVNAEKESLISYYVYYRFIEGTEIKTTVVGSSKSKKENSKHAGVINKMVNAWNSFIQLYGVIPREIARNTCDYYWINNGNYSIYNIDQSAYNFLATFKNDYPEWIFKPQKKINVFGI